MVVVYKYLGNYNLGNVFIMWFICFVRMKTKTIIYSMIALLFLGTIFLGTGLETNKEIHTLEDYKIFVEKLGGLSEGNDNYKILREEGLINGRSICIS